MNQPTTQFLVNLSHAWAPLALSAPVILGAAIYSIGKIQKRAQSGASATSVRYSSSLRIIAQLLFGASLVLCALSFLHIGCASLVSQQSQCISNVKQLTLGTLMYVQDYDEHFPASSQWNENIATHVKKTAASNGHTNDDPFQCPAATSPASYGFNKALNSLPLASLEEPANTVLFFEANAPTRSFAGGIQDVATKRHNGSSILGLADGHAKRTNSATLKEYVWTPKAVSSKPASDR